MRFLTDDCNLKEISPLTLAFIGDGVFEIFVRERLVCTANRPVNELHRLTVQHVKAIAQKQAMDTLMPQLTQAEITLFKRGRNAKSNSTPKNASEADYHWATGFECLWGYLYLDGQLERLRTLFELIV